MFTPKENHCGREHGGHRVWGIEARALTLTEVNTLAAAAGANPVLLVAALLEQCAQALDMRHRLFPRSAECFECGLNLAESHGPLTVPVPTERGPGDVGGVGDVRLAAV